MDDDYFAGSTGDDSSIIIGRKESRSRGFKGSSYVTPQL
jgi:hypothetical protein